MRRSVAITVVAALAVAGCNWFAPKKDAEGGDAANEPVAQPMTAPAPDAGSPEAASALLMRVYAEVVPGGKAKPPHEIGATTRSLTALWRASESTGESVIDFEPVTDSQDPQVSDLLVRPLAPPADGKMTMVAQFRNFGTDTTVHYDLLMEDGGWRIDNIRKEGENGWNLREMLRPAVNQAAQP